MIEFYTTAGLIQRAESIDDLLEDCNRNGNFYEVRENDGRQVIWHKGHRYVVGVFKKAAAERMAEVQS